MLIVLRGNSGSGKSTVARLLQRRLPGPVALIEQDHFRRIVYREREQEGFAHGGLMEAAASWSLEAGHSVVVEGIMNAVRYAPMLERLAGRATDARFFAFDLEFEETVRRHATRPKATFSVEDMRGWFHGWQPLPFVAEERITAEESVEHIVDRILRRRARP